MITSRIAFVLLSLGLSMLVATASATATDDDDGLIAVVVDQPRISLDSLRSALSSSDQSRFNLHQLLHNSRGILRISVDNDFSKLRRRALGHLCDCPILSPAASHADGGAAPTFEEAAKLHPKDLQEITLPDGARRRTLASATIGFDDSGSAVTLELPSWVGDSCGQDAYNAFEDLRDAVAEVVDLFVSRLDQEGNYQVERKGNHLSYRQVLSDANHLEHFHVYTKFNDDGRGNKEHEELQWNRKDRMHGHEPSTLDYHTDAGFFLSFVPAMDCRTRTTDNTSFFLKGAQKPLAFEGDEVVIMMGAGAQYWLPPLFKSEEGGFLAASHALRLSHGTHRAWYGKMHLFPSSFASIRNNDDPPLKYGTATSSFQLEDYDAHVPSSPVDGCGTISMKQNSVTDLPYGEVRNQSRRRLQHVNSPTQCNNQTNFFCWYQCIDIPSSEQAEKYIQDGYSLYCLNPALLSSSDNPILDATEPCEGGFVHNSHCVGSWQKTDASVPGYRLPYEVSTKDNSISSDTTYSTSEVETGDRYCYGGTSMYMEGFTWQDTTCVIYLFSSWVLTTPGKFAMAALGSILLGVALEFVLWKRRGVYALPAGRRRLVISTTIYGLQLAMGYVIMLVIMTYSGPLFISTIGGMMLGHLLFNAQDSLARQWRETKNGTEMNGDTFRTDMNGNDSLEANSLFIRRDSTILNTELNSYQHGKGSEVVESITSPQVIDREKYPATESTNLRSDDVADGATPCCQYTL